MNALYLILKTVCYFVAQAVLELCRSSDLSITNAGMTGVH